MLVYLGLLICGLCALALQAIHHAYFRLPPKELKRRAATKREFKNLQMVTAYGSTAHSFLGFFTFVFAAATVIIIARLFDPLLALFVLAIFAGLFWIVSRRKSSIGHRVAVRIAPQLSKLLQHISPVTEMTGRAIPDNRKPSPKTHIYEKEDLKDFLDHQKGVANNRISETDLNNAIQALDFGGKKIRGFMVPKEEVHFVSTKDPIGPILLSELHKTGFDCFPVKGNGENEVVGMLHMLDLTRHTSGGVVADAMQEKVAYVNENAPLSQVFQAHEKTGMHVFVVIDNDEKITGLISVNDVLKQIVGGELDTAFENFDDPKAVARGSDVAELSDSETQIVEHLELEE